MRSFRFGQGCGDVPAFGAGGAGAESFFLHD